MDQRDGGQGRPREKDKPGDQMETGCRGCQGPELQQPSQAPSFPYFKSHAKKLTLGVGVQQPYPLHLKFHCLQFQSP